MKKKRENPRENGQVIPIVIVLIFAVFLMIALLLDGSSLMLKRRQAQAAADAGALAGARELCQDASSAVVINVAESYANLNDASTSQASVAGGLVTVQTTVGSSSFFAKIFNADTLVSSAEATAGCFAPSSGTHVLPVSWSCKAPVGGSDSPDCQIHTLDWETEMKPLVTGTPGSVHIDGVGDVTTPMNFKKDVLDGYIYIVVDANKVNDDVASTCMPDGDMNCDINGDGINEVFGGGDRSWLDLDGGGGGASSLKNWILHGYDGTLKVHTWLAGQAGVETSVYKAVQEYMDTHPTYPVVMVPVFNGICDGNPLSHSECIDAIPGHIPPPGGDIVVTSGGVSNTYFHIAGFSALYITCIDDGGGNKCPGAKKFLALPGNSKLKNIKLIEGYFISDYPFDLDNPGTGGVDVGIRIVSLTQ